MNAFDRDAYSGWGAVVHVMLVLFNIYLEGIILICYFFLIVKKIKSLSENSKQEWISHLALLFFLYKLFKL